MKLVLKKLRELRVIVNLPNVLLMLITACSLIACVEIATSVVSNVAVQKAMDATILNDNLPHKVCRVSNVIDKKQICRIKRIYRRA